MKFKISFFFLVLALSCSQDTILKVTPAVLTFEANGGSQVLSVTTDADSWAITSSIPDWMTLSKNSGSSTDSLIKITVSTKTLEQRSDTLILSAGNAQPVSIVLTQDASDYLYSMMSSTGQLNFSRNGSTIQFDLNTTAPQWSISKKADWISLNNQTGTTSAASVSVTVSTNSTGKERIDTLLISAPYTPSASIVITQSGDLYPSYNTSPLDPDPSNMSSTATQLAKAMFAGWNLGNSLEVPGGETLWGNPKTTQRLIDSIYSAGFNAIRLPCAWDSYIENKNTCQLRASWLTRVKEVIDYCYKNNMYALINIHWDGGWLENNCTTAKKVENNAKQKAIWEQIATFFRDYDEHLLFAGTNEPNVANSTEMSVLLSYEQTFIDAVRSTGGRNTYRTLVFQGPSTDIETTSKLMNTLPTDKTPNRLMAEIHYYTPWNFCGLDADASWGKMFYYWGTGYHSSTDPTRNATWGEESTVLTNFGLMKSKFTSKGIPVILGEYGAMRRSNLTGDALTKHLASRAYFYEYVTRQAKNYGLVPFIWDNGGMATGGCGLFNRNSNSVFDQQALNSLMQGAKSGNYPY